MENQPVACCGRRSTRCEMQALTCLALGGVSRAIHFRGHQGNDENSGCRWEPKHQPKVKSTLPLTAMGNSSSLALGLGSPSGQWIEREWEGMGRSCGG